MIRWATTGLNARNGKNNKLLKGDFGRLRATAKPRFWLQVLRELQNRGVKDIRIACVDGLKGFPEAIEAVYPRTEVQLCIVHLVRASLNYLPWKIRKPVAADLQSIYRASTMAEAEQHLEALEAKWKAYPSCQPSVAAELGAHHAVFQLPAGHQEGDLYHQQRGVVEPVAAQDHQNPWGIPQ